MCLNIEHRQKFWSANFPNFLVLLLEFLEGYPGRLVEMLAGLDIDILL